MQRGAEIVCLLMERLEIRRARRLKSLALPTPGARCPARPGIVEYEEALHADGAVMAQRRRQAQRRVADHQEGP
jgi:hypothetical protein